MLTKNLVIAVRLRSIFACIFSQHKRAQNPPALYQKVPEFA